MNVTKITDYQNRETIEALRELLSRAEQGRIRAFAFSVKTGTKRHLIGFTGDYWTDPADALGSITRMEYKANQLISARDDEPDTRSMPL